MLTSYFIVPFISIASFILCQPLQAYDYLTSEALDTIDIENIVVSATRLDEAEAATYSTIDYLEVINNHFGQDPSTLLQRLAPSILSYSDAGTEIGNYTQFRMRGMDQTRINTSLNGVPLNDMIDQGVFFSNFSDIGSSVQSVQIQRGVGITNGGLSSYAGTVSFRSPDLFGDGPEGSAELGIGSFNTKRFTTQFNTGQTGNGIGFYGRMSRTLTDGYKTHSGSDAYSLFASGGYLGERDILRITAFAGKTQNDQAYLPVLLSDIKRDPKTNYNHPNDTDDFEQELVQLQYSYFFSDQLATTATLYYGGARGIFPFGLDAATQLLFGLTNNHYGILNEWEWNTGAFHFNTGFHAYTFRRSNQNFTAPNISVADYEDKTNKDEFSLFAKTAYMTGRWTLQADLQVRLTGLGFDADEVLSFGGTVPSGPLSISRSWTFFNPRFGFSFQADQSNFIYASVGLTGREPTRTDILQGDGSSINEFNVTSLLDEELVVNESVIDFELGWRKKSNNSDIQVNLFHMDFGDEISQVGALAERSYIPLRQNIPNSRRTGLEIVSAWKPSDHWKIGLLLTFMDTKVDQYEALNGLFTSVQHIFAPTWIASPSIAFQYSKNNFLSLNSRYVSDSFMELSNDTEYLIPEYFILDLSWKQTIWKNVELFLAVNNILDKLHFNDGAPVDLDFDGNIDGPGYRIQAPRNFYFGLKYCW